MAMAKPIVTTHAPGCDALVDEGRNGFLVPVRDADALAIAVEKLVVDADMRRRFGIASREKCRTEFSDEIVVRRIVAELYEIGAQPEDDPAQPIPETARA